MQSETKKTKMTIRIAHMADIHIKDQHRDNYAEVFTKLYKLLRGETPDIIVVAGDVFETKTKASANNFMDVAKFLMSLVDIAPVVMIPGNHDTNIRFGDDTGPDLLTPVIAENPKLQAPALTYFRRSGVYAAHGIVWAVVAPDGGKIDAKTVQEQHKILEKKGEVDVSAPRICLFHEEVDGALLPSGITLRENRLRISDLNPYDLALGGHIHLRQGGKRWSYCGSLIQQNIGEHHDGHGFLLWELTKSTACPPYRTEIPKRRGVDVPNERGFLRVEIKDGKDVTKEPRPNNPYIYRIQHDKTTERKFIDEISAELQKKIGFPPRTIDLIGSDEMTAVTEDAKSTIQEVRAEAVSFEAHEIIIRKILGKSIHVDEVIAMHREKFEEHASVVQGRSRIRLLRLEFSNMYCFGPGNAIDFTKLEGGIGGIIAPNFSGKSTLIDTIVYALFDECPRGEKKTDAFNKAASSFYVRLEFEIEGQKAVIVKGGAAGGKGSKQKTHTFVVGDDNRTQGDVKSTCAEIRKVVGDYEAAQLTSISHQEQDKNSDFVQMKPKDRKSAFAKILALGSFDQLEKEMKKQTTQLNAEIKAAELRFKGKSVEELEEELGNLEGAAEDLKLEASDLRGVLASGEKDEKIRQQALADLRARAKTGNQNAPDLRTARLSFDKTHIELKALYSKLGVSDIAKIATEAKQYVNLQVLATPPSSICLREELQSLQSRVVKLRATAEELRNQVPETPKLKELHEVQAKIASIQERISQGTPSPQKSLYAAVPWQTQRQSGITTPPHQEEVTSAHKIVKSIGIPFGELQIHLGKLSAEPFVKATETKGEFKSLAETEESDKMTVSQLTKLLNTTSSETISAQYSSIDEKIKTGVEALPKEKLDTIASKTESVASAIEQMNLAEAAFAASEKGSALLGQFNLQDDCIGCDSVRAHLSETGLVALRRSRDSTKLLFAAKLLSSIRHKAELENARRRLSRLSELHEERLRINRDKERQTQIALTKQAISAVSLLETAAWHYSQREAENARIKIKKDTEDALKTELAELLVQQTDLGKKIAAHEKATAQWQAAEKKHDDAIGKYNESLLGRGAAIKRAEAVHSAHVAAQENIRSAEEWMKRNVGTSVSAPILAEAEARAATASQNVVDIRKTLEQLLENAAEKAGQSRELTVRLETERERAEQLNDAKTRADIVKAYRVVLKPSGGIADHLLAKARGRLTELLSKELAETGAKFEVQIGKDFELYTKAPTGQLISVGQSSGYQKFAISLALRRSIWKLASVPVLDCLIIDEGFAACDEENLIAMAEHLEQTAGLPDAPQMTLVVSHLEALRNRLDKALTIKKLTGGSHVGNSTITELKEHKVRPPILQAENKIDKDDELTRIDLLPDAAKPGNVYCPACKKSLTSGRAEKHHVTATHQKALVAFLRKR